MIGKAQVAAGHEPVALVRRAATGARYIARAGSDPIRTPRSIPPIAETIIPRIGLGWVTKLLPSHLPDVTADRLDRLLDSCSDAAQIGD